MPFISTKAVYRLIGDSAPLSVPKLVSLLEKFCRHLESSGDSRLSAIPKRLLRSNQNRRGIETAEMAGIDADIRIEFNELLRTQDVSLLDYPTHNFERPREQQRVVLHIKSIDKEGLMRAIHVPFQALMVGWGDVDAGYQGYSHSIAFFNDENRIEEERFYVGISSRSWLKRMDEHLAEVRRGSNRLFHRTWREYQGHRRVMLSSELVVLNHTYNGIMAWEEEIVREYMEAGTSLNMIPGGFEGMRLLHQQRLTQSSRVSLEERDRALEAYYLAHPRSGVPNLLVSKAWESDEYYAKVITGRRSTLSAEQVRMIRQLSSEGLSVGEIQARIGARNLGQIKRVLEGATYGRIT